MLLTLDHGPDFSLNRMETILFIARNPAAPIACDMSAATDSPNERLEEYRQLFTESLLRVERRPGIVEFRFAPKPGVRERCIDLASREAACCPFLGCHLTADDDSVSWSMTGDEQIEAVRVFLDMFEDAPAEFLKAPGALASALERRGVVFIDGNGTTGFDSEPA